MKIPTHIAIIPDGNRRWAKERALPSIQGHRYSADKILPELIKKSADLGIKYFTFWALSTENLKSRSKLEISGLFNLTRIFIKKKIREFKEKGIKLLMIGDLKKLPEDVQNLINNSIEKTKQNKRMTIIFAVNYGGRDEILRAAQKVQSPPLRKGFEVQAKSKVQSLTKEQFEKNLDTFGIPDPDLIIRTGGERRLSGFLPWQSVYSELYFTDTYFPDFNQKELIKAIEDYSLRKRRFGK